MVLQHISTEAIIKGMVRKDAAWQVVSDFQNYPSLMRNVDKVVVRERGEREGTSEWFVTFDNAPMHWLERDTFDESKYGIDFESIDGDFDRISGSWKVEDLGGEGIKLRYFMDYRLGIPVIEEVVGDVLREKLEKNASLMMLAIKNELDKPTRAEERACPRIQINRDSAFFLNGREIKALVRNVSRKGMMFVASAETHPGEALFIVDGVTIGAEMLCDRAAPNKFRAIFQKEIRQDELDHLVEYFSARNYPSATKSETAPVGSVQLQMA